MHPLEKKYHETLARYFMEKPLFFDETFERPNVRKCTEQPYQQATAGLWDEAEEHSLCNLRFIMAKARGELFNDLHNDYSLVLEENGVHRSERAVWHDFVRGATHIVRRGGVSWPSYKILFQLALEHADSSPVTRQAETLLRNDQVNWYFLRKAERPKEISAFLYKFILEGHSDVSGVKELGNGNIVSWQWQKDKHELRLWNPETGKCIAVLGGHSDGIDAVIELSDDEFLSGSNYTLRIWNAHTGDLIAGQDLAPSVSGLNRIDHLTKTDNGDIRYYAGKSLRVWKKENGRWSDSAEILEECDECRKIFPNGFAVTSSLWNIGPEHPCGQQLAGKKGGNSYTDSMLLANGNILSWFRKHYWAEDVLLVLSSSRTGGIIAVLEGHKFNIGGIRELKNGTVASWSETSNETAVRLWDSGSGGCIALLEGHTKKVRGILELADGRILTWSEDTTLRIWDEKNFHCRSVLNGHVKSVDGAIELSTGDILSWAWHDDFRMWDAGTGECRAVMKGHTSYIHAMELRNKKILSWSGQDHSLRLWDVRTGALIAEMEGHNAGIFNVIELNNGNILSWSHRDGDKHVRIWSADTGSLLATLEGYTSEIVDVKVLKNGSILSCYRDGNLIIWDNEKINHGAANADTDFGKKVFSLANGSIVSKQENSSTLFLIDTGDSRNPASMTGHTSNGIGSFLELTNGDLLSWCYCFDTGLCVWNVRNGKNIAVLKNHTDRVNGALELTDGAILTWSEDKTLCLWDSDTYGPVASLSGHDEYIDSAIELSNGRVVSWDDKSLRLWNVHSRACLAVMRGHTDQIYSVIELTDGNLLSWSGDATLRLWDSTSGRCKAVFTGHTYGIENALELKNGYILSWCFSDNKDLVPRIWDPDSGSCIAGLQGHGYSIKKAVELGDGKILTWCTERDHAPRIWDPLTGRCLMILETNITERYNHITNVVQLSDGNLLLWTGFSIRIFDITAGQVTVTMEDRDALSFIDHVVELGNGEIAAFGGNKLTLLNMKTGSISEVVECTNYKLHRNALIASGNPGYAEVSLTAGEQMLSRITWHAAAGEITIEKILEDGIFVGSSGRFFNLHFYKGNRRQSTEEYIGAIEKETGRICIPPVLRDWEEKVRHMILNAGKHVDAQRFEEALSLLGEATAFCEKYLQAAPSLEIRLAEALYVTAAVRTAQKMPVEARRLILRAHRILTHPEEENITHPDRMPLRRKLKGLAVKIGETYCI